MEIPSAGRVSCGVLIVLAIGLAGFEGIALAASLTPADWLAAFGGCVLGALAADAITGLVHWGCDTWGDERTRWLGPSLIRGFREHHDHPQAMLAHHWTEVNREPVLAAAAALLLLWIPAVRDVLSTHPAVHAFVWSLLVYAAAANQIHLWAHANAAPAPVRWLQRCRLVLSPDAHEAHHHAPNTRSYCISTGWLNPLLDAMGFWRQMERLVTRLTGFEAHGDRR